MQKFVSSKNSGSKIKTLRRMKSIFSTNVVNLSLLMILNMTEFIFTIISKNFKSFLQLLFSI